MPQRSINSASSGGAHETDAVIIGAGPCGLFAVFELGLLGISSHVIDILHHPGGQCTELYPEKPILDIPGIPVITGAELTERLLEQIAPFDATFHLGEMATALERASDGDWLIRTDLDTAIKCRVVIIAAGGGSFTPKRPPIPGIEAYENRNVHYAVRNKSEFADKALIIAGGGDSALDWTVNLHDFARHVTLIHRRAEFRAAPDTVEKMRALADTGAITLKIGEILGVSGSSGSLRSISVRSDERVEELFCDALLAFFGLTMKLGPIAEFGVNLHENRIATDTEKFETSVSGIFCIGDMATYPGKLKLILSGFHEAALMAHGAYRYVFPDKKLRFQHTTSAKSLQAKLGLRD